MKTLRAVEKRALVDPRLGLPPLTFRTRVDTPQTQKLTRETIGAKECKTHALRDSEMTETEKDILYTFWERVYVKERKYVKPEDWEKYCREDRSTNEASTTLASVYDGQIVATMRATPIRASEPIPTENYFSGLKLPPEFQPVIDLGKVMKQRKLGKVPVNTTVLWPLYVGVAKFGFAEAARTKTEGKMSPPAGTCFLLPLFQKILERMGIEFTELEFGSKNAGTMGNYFERNPKPLIFELGDIVRASTKIAPYLYQQILSDKDFVKNIRQTDPKLYQEIYKDLVTLSLAV